MNTKLKFAFEKETEGAVRYQEVGEDGRQHSRRRSVRSTSAKAQCRAETRKHLLLLSQANNLKSDAQVEETREVSGIVSRAIAPRLCSWIGMPRRSKPAALPYT